MSLVSSGWSYVQLWDPVSSEKLAEFNDPAIWIRSLALGKVSGRTSLAITTRDSIIFWDPVSETTARKYTGCRNIHFVEWGKIGDRTVAALAVVEWPGSTIHIWEPSAQRTLYSLHNLSGSVTALAWITWKGRPAIAIANGGSVVIWDVSHDREEIVVASYSAGISNLAWLDREGGLLAIATYDGIIHIYDPESTTELSAFRAHYGMIRSLKWCPSGDQQLLASCGEDHALHIWNPRSSDRSSSVLGNDAWINAVAWGQLGGRNVLAIGGHDGLVRVWEPSAARDLTAFTAHESAVHALSWGEIAGSPVLASGGDDGIVRIWDPLLKREISRFSGHDDAITPFPGRKIGDRAVLATASDDGSIFVWDAMDGNSNVLFKVAVEWGYAIFGWITQGESPMLAIGDGRDSIEIWDPVIARKVRQFGTGIVMQRLSCIRSDARTFLAASSNSFAVDADSSVQIWEVESGKEIRGFEVAGEIISGLTWGTVNQRCVLACSIEDGAVYLYDMNRDVYSVFRCDAAVLDIDMAKNGFLAIGHTKGVEAIVLTDHWLSPASRVLGLSIFDTNHFFAYRLLPPSRSHVSAIYCHVYLRGRSTPRFRLGTPSGLGGCVGAIPPP